MINLNRHLVHYLTRPFNLFETSLWQSWYDSVYMEQVFGKKATGVLCLEDLTHQSRQYRTKSQFLYFGRKTFALIVLKRKLMEALLKEAFVINKQAIEALDKGPSSFANLEEAVDFLTKLAFYCTILPNFPTMLPKADRFIKGRLKELITQVRSVSYYPVILKEIITPLAIGRLNKLRVNQPQESIKLITIRELLSGDVSKIEERKRDVKDGKYFIFQTLGEGELVEYTRHPEEIISKLEPTLSSQIVEYIKGKVAFPGYVQGTVKVVTNYETSKNDFMQGNILVAISTNPEILPLMTKAAAIVTDEGGIGSHAAIISRELKIPCIVGTKIATKVLKDGDMVEVNADKGRVKKIS